MAGGLSHAINGQGVVPFFATTVESGQGLFAARAGMLQLVIFEGQAAPGMPGEQIRYFDNLAINDAGQIVFGAATTNSYGVFLATPLAPEVPLLPAWALAVLGGALAAIGGRLRTSGSRLPSGRECRSPGSTRC
jgi:hypothetical protein